MGGQVLRHWLVWLIRCEIEPNTKRARARDASIRRRLRAEGSRRLRTGTRRVGAGACAAYRRGLARVRISRSPSRRVKKSLTNSTGPIDERAKAPEGIPKRQLFQLVGREQAWHVGCFDYSTRKTLGGPTAMLLFLLHRHAGRRIMPVLALLLVLASPPPVKAEILLPPGFTSTTSTTSHTTFIDSFQTESVDTFLTRIVARVDGGFTVYDQTFDAAFGSATVQAAVAAALAALNAEVDPDPTIVGPTLISNQTFLADSQITSTQSNGGTITTTSAEINVGPDSLLTGNRDLGGILTIVPAGGINTNTNVDTEFLINRVYLTTNTYLTSQTYELVGYPQQVVAGVPEPASLGLLGLGLAGLAAQRRRHAA